MAFSPNDFIHPEDRAAREKLEAIPGFAAAMKGFLRLFNEQLLHGTNMAQKIRLGPSQLPEIHRLLPPICDRLGIAEPEFYLEMNPVPNAYTFGDTRISITLTSALVHYLEEDELRAVIAHECGHIVCRHVLYHTMAQMLLSVGASMFGAVALVAEPIRLGLLYWSRRSEFSADRAAAVVMGGAQPVVETMVRLAGGPISLTKDVNMEEYLRQADAYDRLLESGWDKFLQGLAVMNASHPFPAVRSREIVNWCRTADFRRLQGAAEEMAAPKRRCPKCSTETDAAWKFCIACGAACDSTGGDA